MNKRIDVAAKMRECAIRETREKASKIRVIAPAKMIRDEQLAREAAERSALALLQESDMEDIVQRRALAIVRQRGIDIDNDMKITRTTKKSLKRDDDVTRVQRKAVGPISVRRLNELKFDPLAEMVDLYRNVQYELAEIEQLKLEPSATRRYSAMAHGQLLALQQKLVDSLLRYGYARVPEAVTIEQKEVPGLVINMTPVGGVFMPSEEAL